MKDQVARENRKALPRFFGTLLLFALLGGVGGFFVSIAGFSGLAGWAAEGLTGVLAAVVPWGIPTCSVILLGIGLGLYRSAKGRYDRWDGEDEALAEGIEVTLSYVLLFTTLATVVDFFFLSAVFLCDAVMVTTVLFLVSIVLIVLLQQKAIDLTRRMNPEKQGSVYDVKFQKKWMDSCDEAEKAQMGQAAYQAFRVATGTCLVLWVVLTVLNFSFDIGLLPVLMVLILFGVLQVTYCLTCIKLSRSK